MSPLELFTTTLKQAGMRLTPQRIAICKLLSETDAHPTAFAIYEQIRAQYPSLSLMTVYNTLNTLVNLGVVNALGGAGDDNVHYDGNTTPHINLACIACHKIIDIASVRLNDLEGEVASLSGYKVIGTRIVYYGLCPDCQKMEELGESQALMRPS
jgi:Fur family transcriptional regulator, peroxide stress response regulator